MILDLWYTKSPLDRVSQRRRDDIWPHALRKAEQTRIVPVWRSRNLVHVEDERALLPTLAEAGDLLETGRFASLLGIHDGIAYFAVDISHVEDRSDEHTSELPSLMRLHYSLFCLTQKN